MTTYVMRDGALRDKHTGQLMAVSTAALRCPSVRSDLQPYRSPIDGREVGSRSGQREDLKRNDCVLAPPRKKPRGYKNPEFAKKRGLPVHT